MKIVPQSVELLAVTTLPLELLEKAARVCYRSEDKIAPGSAERLVGSCMTKNHMSIIEHASATFRIVCDRGISHEIVRHRIASYSQESTRYCNYGKDKFDQQITVIEPPGLTSDQRFMWRESVTTAERSYLHMLALGVTPQIARSVLPTCLKTELVMTANFREWRHFIDLRTSAAAHPQIRQVACWIRLILTEVCPVVFAGCSRQENLP